MLGEILNFLQICSFSSSKELKTEFEEISKLKVEGESRKGQR